MALVVVTPWTMLEAFLKDSWTDMLKGVDTRTLSAEILTDCGNCSLATLNFSFICFLMLKYYGTFTFIIQYDHLNKHLNLIAEI